MRHLRRLSDRLWAWATIRRDTLVDRALGPARPTPPAAVPLELTPETRAAIRRTLT